MPDRICVLFVTGISGQTVHQQERDAHTVEGAAVTLDCSSDRAGNIDYTVWYKQEGNASPEFILSPFKIGHGKKAEKYVERFRSTMKASPRHAPLSRWGQDEFQATRHSTVL
uniref:Immunoglobulin V-set domain-containing protein n=1 Tax=Hippocampus comes TaxID=109280 RepID=A0A3Q2XLJ5_HIPCM